MKFGKLLNLLLLKWLSNGNQTYIFE